MPGQKIQLGPWRGCDLRDIGAINQGHGPPTHFPYVVNLSFDDQGYLRPRPGCRVVPTTDNIYTDGTGKTIGKFYVLGSLRRILGPSFVAATISASYSDLSSSFWYTEDGLTWAKWGVTNNFASTLYTAAVAYNGFYYAVPGNSATVGKRIPDIDSVDAWVNIGVVGDVPYGHYVLMHKDRMFIFRTGADRVFYSKATDPTVWTAPDGGFFDVNPDDGDSIRDVALLQDTIFIFKRNSTYMFTFQTDPAEDGYLRLVNSEYGAYSTAIYGNDLYVANSRGVFRLVNTNFVNIAPFMNFYSIAGLDNRLIPSPHVGLNIVNNHLVVGPVDNQFWTHFAMNLNTGAWTGWRFQDGTSSPSNNNGPTFRGAQCLDFAGGFTQNRMVFGNGTSFIRTMWNAPDSFFDKALDVNTTGGTESPEYSFITSRINGGDEASWKKLHRITADWYVDLPPLDADVTLALKIDRFVNDIYSAPHLESAFKSNTIPEFLLPIKQHRFRYVRLSCLKPYNLFVPATSADQVVQWELQNLGFWVSPRGKSAV